MTWRRAARFGVAGVGLATALAVVLLTRDRPEPAERGTSTPVDPTATLQAGRGVDTRYRGNERTAIIDYESIVQRKDGSTAWTNAQVTLKDGSALTAGLVESVGKATSAGSPGAELACSQGVRLTTAAGDTLAAASATYNDATGVATLPGAVTFSRGRMSGSGTGAVQERDTGTFRVLADVQVTMQADASGGAVKASAESMTFTEATRSMLFDRRARIARQAEELSADRAVLFLSDNDAQFRAIELRGNAHVTPSPGQSTGLPDMQAASIDLAFYDGAQALKQASLVGQARVVLAGSDGNQSIDAPRITIGTAPDGKTLTLLEGSEGVTVKTPATKTALERTIVSPTLKADGNPKDGLLAALFQNGVTFTEAVPAAPGRPASTREGKSQTLMLELGGGLGTVKKATFRQAVTFKDGGVTGDADVVDYFATDGKLELRPAITKPSRSRVTDGRVTVDASELITVDLSTHNLHARGGVNTSMAGESTGPSRGFFKRGERVLGASAEFYRDSTKKTLRYVGTAAAPAWLRQGGDSEIKSSLIVVDEGTDDLTATGRVNSIFTLAARPAARGGAAEPPTKYSVTADALVYDERQRTATYTGTPVVLNRPGESETRAKTVVLTLASGDQRLERLDATGEMTTKLSSGRDAKGDLLIYEAAADRYTLQGSPVSLRTPDQGGVCSVSTGRRVRFTGNGAAEQDWPAADNPGGALMSKASCTALLP